MPCPMATAPDAQAALTLEAGPAIWWRSDSSDGAALGMTTVTVSGASARRPPREQAGVLLLPGRGGAEADTADDRSPLGRRPGRRRWTSSTASWAAARASWRARSSRRRSTAEK